MDNLEISSIQNIQFEDPNKARNRLIDQQLVNLEHVVDLEHEIEKQQSELWRLREKLAHLKGGLNEANLADLGLN